MIGFRSEFTQQIQRVQEYSTHYLILMHHGLDYRFPQRNSGVIIADEYRQYASLAMADREELFTDIGTEVYKGIVVGEEIK